MTSTTTNVCFAGITGWTAPPILEALHASDDCVWSRGSRAALLVRV